VFFQELFRNVHSIKDYGDATVFASKNENINFLLDLADQVAKEEGNEFEDTITWNVACPADSYNKYKSISNLQLNADNTIRGINYWLLDSAISWFIENQKTFDPATTLPIRTGLIKRIILQKRLVELVPVEMYQILPPTDKLIENAVACPKCRM
jgi:hypothetical protein